MILLRTLVAIVAAFAVVALLAWSPTKRVASDKVPVRYWVMIAAEDTESYSISSFNASRDDIEIQRTAIPWTEHEKKILTAVLSGDPPDVISQFAPVVQWASRMALTPLDDYIAASDLDTSVFFPALMDEMQWQGHTFALPVFTASYAFYYNKAIFREAGLDPERPPRTWDEVLRASAQIEQSDAEGRLLRVGYLPAFSAIQSVVLGSASAAQLMAWQLEADFLAPDGEQVQLATPPVERAFAWTCDFYAERDLNAFAAFIGGLGTKDQHGFLTGKLAMAVLDMSFLGEIERHRPDLEFGVVSLPTFENGKSASVSGSWWLGIPRGAKHPDEAWEFIRHCVDKTTILEEALSRELALFPANRDAAHDPRFFEQPHAPIFIQQMEHAHSPVVVPLAHSVFWREFNSALERAVQGTQSIRESLQQAEQVIQAANSRAFDYDTFVRSRMSFQ